jgi:hypothetical protein
MLVKSSSLRGASAFSDYSRMCCDEAICPNRQNDAKTDAGCWMLDTG